MKKAYEKPELQITELAVEDVIAASSGSQQNEPLDHVIDKWQILLDFG